MRMTVVLPVRNGIDVLPRCVEALERSVVPCAEWDLVVVDDGSTDGSGAWAEARGLKVRRVEHGPKGPAAARNLGAEGARGEVVVFVDADVCLAPDALGRFGRLFEARPDLGAAFGVYDDRPDVPGFFSQYRNLYHRYVHLRGNGPAETFWAGCGAVRREVFEACGTFDEVRYRRPQVEDIDLGYRIRAAGWKIELDASIECRHLKTWSLATIVHTDLFDRGIPWMRLLMEGRNRLSLNVRGPERLRTAAVGLAAAMIPFSVLAGAPALYALALGVLFLVVLTNVDLYRWFAAQRGWVFALGVVFMNLLYYLTASTAAALGLLLHLGMHRPGAAR